MTMPNARTSARLAAFICGATLLSIQPGCAVILGDSAINPVYSQTLDENLNNISGGQKPRTGEDVLRVDAMAEWDTVWAFTEGTPWAEAHATLGGDIPADGVMRNDILILVDNGIPTQIFSLRIVSFSSSGQHMSRDGSFQRAPDTSELELVD